MTFYNGSHSLDATALMGGVATFNLTSLPVGASALTASYPGDPSFVASASAPVAHTVMQPTASFTVVGQSMPFGTASATLMAQLTFSSALAPIAPLSFTMDSGAAVIATCTGSASPLTCTATYAAAGTTSQTFTSGSVATFTFAHIPEAIAYPGKVSFVVSGLAPGVAYTLSPTSVATSACPATVTLSVQTVKLTSQTITLPPWTRLSGVAFAGLLLPFSALYRYKVRLVLLLWCGFLFASACTGCGSRTPAPTPVAPVTSTITVVATTAGYAITYIASVALIVQ